MFNALGRSTVCYGSEAFGYGCYDEINLVQRFFVKRILKLPMSSPNYMIMTECGILPLHLQALKLHMNYILKVMFEHEDNRLTKQLWKSAIANNSEMWNECFMLERLVLRGI